jgi:hypothetical protein
VTTAAQGGLTGGCAARLAAFAQAAFGANIGPNDVLTDICYDTLLAIAALLAPVFPPAFMLEAILQLQLGADAGTDTATLDAAVVPVLATVQTVLTQTGLLGMTAAGRPSSGGTAPAAGGVGSGGQGNGAGPDVTQEVKRLGPVPTQDAVNALPKPPDFTKVEIARSYEQYGRIPGTPAWDSEELKGRFAAARTLETWLPAYASLLALFDLHEEPSSLTRGERVHERLQAMYRLRHADEWVMLDRVVWKGDQELGDISEPPVPPTGDKGIDAKITLARLAYGFVKKGFDIGAPGPDTSTGKMFRPDILNLTQGTIIEIKPVRSLREAVGQLWAYQVFINAALQFEPALGTMGPGWVLPPASAFQIRDEDPGGPELWAFAFMFPGLGSIHPLPGIMPYLIFKREHPLEDQYADQFALEQMLREWLIRILEFPEPSEQPDAPGPETPTQDDDGNDSWAPNGHYPGDDQPIAPDQDAPQPEWQPPADSGVAQQPADPAMARLLSGDWVLIVAIVVLFVLAAIAAALALAPIVGPVIEVIVGALATIGIAASALLGETAVAALLVTSAQALMKQTDTLSAGTQNILSARGPAAWSDLLNAASALTSGGTLASSA